MKLPALLALSGLLLLATETHAQARLETGSEQPMPAAEWVDAATGHRIVRLTALGAPNGSFYFHNNPFVKQRRDEGDLMVYYHTAPAGKQLMVLNLKTRQSEVLTRPTKGIHGEIVAPRRREVFYQAGDSVFATHIDSRKTRLVFVFPPDFRADITTLNADETELGGAWASPAEKEISRQYPAKHDYFSRIYESKLPRTLFTVGTQSCKLTKLFTDTAWLNHVQFSPTDPRLLMFCHEGPWEKVDRIWTIDTKTRAVKLIHKRMMDREIAGHEFFSPDGKTIWFDHQQPRGVTFALTGANLKTGQKTSYKHDRNEWSVHYIISPNQRLFAGDGGHEGAVAKAPDGKWIYLFRPAEGRFEAEKLVKMKQHEYGLEPNVHFTPDEKWIVFRANFEGESQVYAVEIAKTAL